MKYKAGTPIEFGTKSVDTTQKEPQNLAATIAFRFDGMDTPILVGSESFQILRRAIPTTDARDEDGNPKENKLRLIQHFRGLTGLGLREAKVIVEWFLENVERELDGKVETNYL